MFKTFAKMGFLAVFSLLVLSGSTGQEKVDATLYPTGLVLPTDERIDEIHRTWPRIVKAGINWLGAERINAVREDQEDVWRSCSSDPWKPPR